MNELEQIEYLKDLAFLQGYGDALKNSKVQTKEQIRGFIKKVEDMIEKQKDANFSLTSGSSHFQEPETETDEDDFPF